MHDRLTKITKKIVSKNKKKDEEKIKIMFAVQRIPREMKDHYAKIYRRLYLPISGVKLLQITNSKKPNK